MTNLDNILKKVRHYFANKGPSSQGYGFSCTHVWILELDYKESWVAKNWCFWIVVLEKTLKSPLDCKEIQPVHPKGNQSWIFNRRTDVAAETPILWPPAEKNWLIGKDPYPGKDWRQEEKGTTEDEMVGWYHHLNGHEWMSSGSWWWTVKPGVLQSMGLQKLVITEWLNWISHLILLIFSSECLLDFPSSTYFYRYLSISIYFSSIVSVSSITLISVHVINRFSLLEKIS